MRGYIEPFSVAVWWPWEVVLVAAQEPVLAEASVPCVEEAKFDPETGDLVMAVMPNGDQLGVMPRLLGH